jgi:hypothetical protein
VPAVTQKSVEWALPTPERGLLAWVASLSFLLIFAIGVLDVAAGPELTWSPLYLVAIIVGTWRGGPWIGLATAIVGTFTGLMADLLLSEPYLHLANDYTSVWIPYCNAAARALVFLGATMTVSKLQALLRDRDRVARELTTALDQVRTLELLLSVCAWCRRIRDEGDANEWKTIERYIAEHTDSKFTHGMCPDCYERVCREEGL